MGRAEDLFKRLDDQGLDAIDQLFADATNEEAFLEFKRSMNHGSDPGLNGKDRENLARALSGFANSDGGIVIWGVGTKGGESAEDRQPLTDCKRFAGALDNAVSGCTVPEVPGVRSLPIPLADGSGRGYVATLIPASVIGPHQLVNGKTYLMRAGSSFQPISHSVLSGMFGRRPQPQIQPNFVIRNARHLSDSAERQMLEIYFDIHVFNNSAVVARDAYVTLRATSLGCENWAMAHYEEQEQNRWQVDASITALVTSALAADGNRVAPLSTQKALCMLLQINLPFTKDVRISIQCGCDGAAPYVTNWYISAQELQSIADVRLARNPGPNYMIQVDNSLAAKILGTDTSWNRAHPS